MLHFYNKKLLVCGTDEAGRGCLSGPVTAAAVILPKSFRHPMLNDSKKLSAKQRAILAPIIKQAAISYGISHVSPQEIDRINILQASIKAMHKSIAKLETSPDFIIVDGNKFNPYSNIPHETIVKGDSKFYAIAAASVLAKTARDEYMLALHKKFPLYQWNKNMGYPTSIHKAAILKWGVSPHHRKTFRGVKDI
ncbi:ribonuclease HII [Flavobacteriaceae bacterium]|jgi:ribonuclease HII|nr:ribonuclease HII [Flavobacteriaceae bacterium]